MLSETAIGAILGITVTAALGGLGFLLRRWITGERSREQVTELSTLAAVASQMRSGGISVSEIEALKLYLQRGHAPEVSSDQVAEDEEPFKTQVEMVHLAALELTRVEGEMSLVIRNLRSVLAPDEIAHLRASQDKWLEFRQAHADFESAMVEGGGIRPLWFTDSVIRLTEDRIRSLRDFFEVRRKL
jgi:uncharacterized protein YecT (DUF1311 family)